jgi:hypothetical protein
MRTSSIGATCEMPVAESIEAVLFKEHLAAKPFME